MKHRLAHLRKEGHDWLEVLWDRHWRAVMTGQGHTYEYADKDNNDLPEPEV